MTSIKQLFMTCALTLTTSLSVAAGAEFTQGVVRKIDKSTQKITLKHEEIKNLDMPGMTMVFKVRDPILLDKARVGDSVKFKAEQLEGGIFVTELEIQ